MSFNSATIVGRLCKDPEGRTTSNGNSVVNFALAVNRDYKGPNGEKETDFIAVTAWRKLAEVVQQYFHKGDLCLVSGSINVQKFKAQDGTQREKFCIVADKVQRLTPKKKDYEEENAGGEMGGNGLPF